MRKNTDNLLCPVYLYEFHEEVNWMHNNICSKILQAAWELSAAKRILPTRLSIISDVQISIFVNLLGQSTFFK